MKHFKRLVLLSFAFSAGQVFALKVTSPDLKDGDTMAEAQVFNSFGCSGENVSPELNWSAAPKGTKSYAVTVYDPDAPTGSGWWHWTVFNIPANVSKLERGAGNDASKLPNGAKEGRTDFGKTGYGGACPPPGDKPHRYIFKVHALKTDKLELDENASGAMVGYYLKQNGLATGQITVRYQRKAN